MLRHRALLTSAVIPLLLLGACGPEEAGPSPSPTVSAPSMEESAPAGDPSPSQSGEVTTAEPSESSTSTSPTTAAATDSTSTPSLSSSPLGTPGAGETQVGSVSVPTDLVTLKEGTTVRWSTKFWIDSQRTFQVLRVEVRSAAAPERECSREEQQEGTLRWVVESGVVARNLVCVYRMTGPADSLPERLKQQVVVAGDRATFHFDLEMMEGILSPQAAGVADAQFDQLLVLGFPGAVIDPDGGTVQGNEVRFTAMTPSGVKVSGKLS